MAFHEDSDILVNNRLRYISGQKMRKVIERHKSLKVGMNGALKELIFDVACSDGDKPNSVTHR